MYGQIHSNWTFDYETKNFNLSVKIPANSTATLYLPTSDKNSILVDDIKYISTETSIVGVKFLKCENNKAIFELQSGSYKFFSIN